MIDQKRACLERTLLVIFDFLITWLAPENNEKLHVTCNMSRNPNYVITLTTPIPGKI